MGGDDYYLDVPIKLADHRTTVFKAEQLRFLLILSSPSKMLSGWIRKNRNVMCARNFTIALLQSSSCVD